MMMDPLTPDDGSDGQQQALYRMLPSVHELVTDSSIAKLVSSAGRARTLEAVRAVLARTRRQIAAGSFTASTLRLHLQDLPALVTEEVRGAIGYSLRRVVNATGVILHTNMGRAPLSQAAIDHLVEVAAGYSNLELDLEHGERGRRDAHVESLLLALLREAAPACSEDSHRAIIVNNCAAATLLVLHALARGREVLVSRGELVEIGGGFRIPEILEASGAILREVGTTNKTRVSDYEKAITSETALILRVHQANFAMHGFVERPGLEELVALGRRSGVGVFEDQGTGLIEMLDPLGVRGEPTFGESVASGCDLVAASGDKLFGGPQCGILAGRKEWVDRVRSHPLYRALRADKLNYAALEATLIQYRYGDREAIPVLRMLRMTEEAIYARCSAVAAAVEGGDLVVRVKRVESVIGGGTTPASRLPSFALSLEHAQTRASALLQEIRRSDPPIIGRIEEECVLLDLRTVEPELDAYLVRTLNLLSGPRTFERKG